MHYRCLVRPHLSTMKLSLISKKTNSTVDYALESMSGMVPGSSEVKDSLRKVGVVSSLVVLAALSGYQFMEHSTLKEALSMEQELTLYSNGNSIFNLEATSLFDQSLDKLPPELRNDNTTFIKQALAHRHELACDRDRHYTKDLAEKGETYLGCSIEPRPGIEAVRINTYGIGEKLNASYEVLKFGEHYEARTHLTFPADFKERVTNLAGEANALDLARVAIEIQHRTRGDVSEISNLNGESMIAATLKRGNYLNRWVLNGGTPDSLWQSLYELGSFPELSDVNLERINASAMVPHVSELQEKSDKRTELARSLLGGPESNLAIQSIQANLDHNCQFSVSTSMMSVTGDLNSSCLQNMGAQRSIQLAASLKSSVVAEDDGVHGAIMDRIVLGSYKGHPVISSLERHDNGVGAYVITPLKTGEWSDGFLTMVYGEDVDALKAESKDDPSAGSFGVLSAQATHFSGGYAPHHTPIIVNPSLETMYKLAELESQSRDLIMEMTLEHEIKHIKDFALFKSNGKGALSRDYGYQQSACDVYAIQAMADKYKDPEVLKKLKDAIKVRGTGFHEANQADAIKAMKGAGIIQGAVQAYSAIETAQKQEHRHDVVIKFIDKKIDELKPRAPVINKAAAKTSTPSM